MHSGENKSLSSRAQLHPNERLVRHEVERVDAELIEQELLAFESELDGMDGWVEDDLTRDWAEVDKAPTRPRAAPPAPKRPKLQPTIIPGRASRGSPGLVPTIVPCQGAQRPLSS